MNANNQYSGALLWPQTGPNGDGVQMLDASQRIVLHMSLWLQKTSAEV